MRRILLDRVSGDTPSTIAFHFTRFSFSFSLVIPTFFGLESVISWFLSATTTPSTGWLSAAANSTLIDDVHVEDCGNALLGFISDPKG